MRLSNLSYYSDFFISMALCAWMLAVVIAYRTWLEGAQWAAAAATGAAAWTLIEYAMHRWFYHDTPYIRDLHAAHHATPGAHIGAPPLIGIVLIFAVCYAPLVSTNSSVASGFTTGMLLGYMAYMLVHHASHYWNRPASSWLARARLHHALHHYHSDACNFGITTAFWDHVFGTALVRKPRRLAPLPL